MFRVCTRTDTGREVLDMINKGDREAIRERGKCRLVTVIVGVDPGFDGLRVTS